MKVKKFLKVLLTIILILCAVGGTAFLFFKNLKTQKDTTGSIYAQTTTGNKLKFDSDVALVTDSRFELLNKTNQNLTDISKVLSSYLVKTGSSITNEKISSSLKKVNSGISKLNRMLEEFNKKSTSPYFDQAVGLNDMYEEMSKYLVNYAKFLSLVNSSLKNVDKQVDIKFTMIDLYCNIVSSTFEQIEDLEGLKVVKDASNANVINACFKLENSILVISDNFSVNCNQFIKNYSYCNQKVLASSFAEILNSVSAYNYELNYETKTAFYFKHLYNIW